MSRMSVLGASLLSAEAASSAIDTLSIDTKFCINQRMNQHVGGIDQQCMSSASSLLCKLEPRTSFDDDLSSFLESADIWMDCSSSSSGTSSNNDASEGEEAIVGGNHGLVFPINPVTPQYQSVGFYPRLPQLGRQLSDVSQSSNGGAVMFTDYSSSPSSSSVASTASSPAMSPIGGGNYFAPFEITTNLNSIVDEEEDEAHNELNDACNSALDAKTMMMMNPLPDLALSDIDAILSSSSLSLASQPSSSSSPSMMSPIAASPSSYIMVKSEPIEMPVFKSEPCSPPASPFMYSSSPSSSASPVSSPESMSSGCSDFPSSPFDQSMSNFNKRYPNTKDCLHVAEFLLSLLVIPEKYGKLIKWERKETGLFRILKPNDVANLWARTKSNKEHMDYPNMARGIRFAREKSGDFDQVTKEDGVGKKLVYKFSQRFRARNDTLQKIMSPQQFEVRRKIKKEEIY